MNHRHGADARLSAAACRRRERPRRRLPEVVDPVEEQEPPLLVFQPVEVSGAAPTDPSLLCQTVTLLCPRKRLGTPRAKPIQVHVVVAQQSQNGELQVPQTQLRRFNPQAT
jgi:hypothetical protein